MFGNGKRNGNGHAVAAITTLIAEGTVIRGDVAFTGGLHLDGRIEGAITADGHDAVLTPVSYTHLTLPTKRIV